MKLQRHHYIPQFYLRPWLGADNKLEEFGKEPHSGQIRSRRRGTNSTGFEYNLYTIPGATEETQQNIERIFMGAVDSTAAAARDELLSGNIPSGESRYAWARFLMSMAMRTPDEIGRFKKSFVHSWMKRGGQNSEEYKKERRPNWPDTLEEYLDQQEPIAAEREAIIIAAELMQHKNVARHMMSTMWWVLDTSSVSRPLMTSDHPFVMTNGIARPDGHFALPISPRHLFIGFKEDDFRKRFQKMPVGKIVRASNEAVIGQARKYAYGLNNSNIAEVRRLMGKRDFVQLFPNIETEDLELYS